MIGDFMRVKDLITELLDMPMNAAVNIVYENEDDFTYKKEIVVVDYEDGEIGLLALSNNSLEKTQP